MKKFNAWSRLKCFARAKAGFTIVEAMVALLILAIALLGVGYALNASFFIDQQSIRSLHRQTDSQGTVGTRDNFNNVQSTVYGTLR